MNKVVSGSILLSLAACLHLQADLVPFIAFRSQGFNAERELVGWQTQINKSCMDEFYGSFSVTPEFTQSFKAGNIRECLFADALTCGTTCNSPVIKIQGTKVKDRSSKALMAENFYLPTDFSSEVSFKPRVQNFLVDFNLYLGLDNFIEGLYFRIHTPLCYTRYDLNMCERKIDSGSNNYDIGYFNNTFSTPSFDDPENYGLARKKLLSSFTEYVCEGESITDVAGITYQGLNRARMSTRTLTKTGLAELTAALGWNFWTGDKYHVGLNLRGAAPTGNKPEGCWLFEPIVGNGHHWELGGGLSAHWRWWTNQDETKEFATYFDVNITSLFSSRQHRTFDLCNKPLSRYMLALRYKNDVTQLNAEIPGGGISVLRIPFAQFDDEFIPVANITTLPVDVSIPLHIDAALKCSYTHCNWQYDLGYSFWYRSCESICINSDCCKNGFVNNSYGLKGDAFVYGFSGVIEDDQLVVTQPGVALSASEHKATIFTGTNNYSGNQALWSSNSGIDLPHNAFSDDYPAGHDYQLYTRNIGTATELAHTTSVNTSYPAPLYITECDLDTDGAKTSGLSNKLFGHIGYTWTQCSCHTPYVGFGGEVEFGQCEKLCGCSRQECQRHETDCCTRCSLSQWGVWIKGGISF